MRQMVTCVLSLFRRLSVSFGGFFYFVRLSLTELIQYDKVRYLFILMKTAEAEEEEAMSNVPDISKRHEMEFRASFSTYVSDGSDSLREQTASQIIIAELDADGSVVSFMESYDLAAIVSGCVGVEGTNEDDGDTRVLVAKPVEIDEGQSNPIDDFLNKLQRETRVLYQKVLIFLDWAKNQEDLRPYMYVPEKEEA